MSPKHVDIELGPARTDGDSDAEMRSAICIYLNFEHRGGATISELAQLTLGGNTPADEIGRVSSAVSQLVQAGEVTMDGNLVRPVVGAE